VLALLAAQHSLIKGNRFRAGGLTKALPLRLGTASSAPSEYEQARRWCELRLGWKFDSTPSDRRLLALVFTVGAAEDLIEDTAREGKTPLAKFLSNYASFNRSSTSLMFAATLVSRSSS
jgi:hypothetical protein